MVYDIFGFVYTNILVRLYLYFVFTCFNRVGGYIEPFADSLAYENRLT